jgi:hypothetical protein
MILLRLKRLLRRRVSRFLADVAYTIGPGDSSSANRFPAETPDLAEVGVESPLIDRAPDDAVAGVVSLDRCCPGNDVTVEMGPPVTATFPSGRWAYGLLFPLDHDALKANQDRAIIVRCDFAVETGLVGIMGVAEGLKRPSRHRPAHRRSCSATSERRASSPA